MFNTRQLIFFAFISMCALTAKAEQKPLKIYILVGQSNMQGHAHISTFDHIGMDPKTAPLLKEMRNADGTPRVCDQVWISSIGNNGTEEERHGKLTAGYGAEPRGPKIGPELTFGIYMQKLVNDPILIIKTAWGGKSLNTDFRPPSAGPYRFNENQIANLKKQGKDVAEAEAARNEAAGKYYRLMLNHVNKVLKDVKRVYPDYDEKVGHELAGFVWFQGWNDMVDSGTYPNRGNPDGYADYSKVMAHFIRDVRKDLKAPELPFVIGVMGAGGPTSEYGPQQQRYKGIHEAFRTGMAAPASLPEFKGNVAAVLTERYWDGQLSELSQRSGQLRAKSKELSADKSLSRQQQQEALAKFKANLYTAEELKILETGISNAAYHYLGSSKIMAQIGKGFAEALFEMSR